MSRTRYKPVLEYCGGTEIGGAFCGGTLLHPCVPSAFATCTLGMELLLLPSDADAAAAGGASGSRVDTQPHSMSRRQPGRGEVAVRAPALGTSQRLLNRDHFAVYFAGMPEVPWLQGRHMRLRRHGDEFEVLRGLGYFRAHGRCDDTMNLGGIKVRAVLGARLFDRSVHHVLMAVAAQGEQGCAFVCHAVAVICIC